MADPKRWSEEAGGATDAERSLLRAARDVGPTPHDREAVLAAVLARVGGGGNGAGGPSGSAGGAPVGTATKGTSKLVVAIGGAIVAGVAVWFFLRATPPEVLPRTIVVASASAPQSAPSSPIVAPVAEPSGAEPSGSVVLTPTDATKATASAPLMPTVTVATPSSSASGTFASRLKEESELISRAREALRAGDYAGALAFVDKTRTKFPNGVLVQERRMLEIEALWRSGNHGQAAALADRFLKDYPNSPNAARVREFQKP